jgi:hypothetical protein
MDLHFPTFFEGIACISILMSGGVIFLFIRDAIRREKVIDNTSEVRLDEGYVSALETDTRLDDKNVESHISGAEQLLKWFGYWPVFHDAEILWVNVRRGAEVQLGSVQVEMGVFAFEFSPHLWYEFVLRRHCIVHFRFTGCRVVSLEGFNQQNQCDSIVFDVLRQDNAEGIPPEDKVVVMKNAELFEPDEVLRVMINAAFGVDGVIHCYQAFVEQVVPCDENGRPLHLPEA